MNQLREDWEEQEEQKRNDEIDLSVSSRFLFRFRLLFFPLDARMTELRLV